jgi:putative peptide zinc metalloprotease protein
MAQPPPNPGLAARLRDVVVAIRGELDISRHVFRAGPAYVVRDPITFATHRFDPEDYQVLNAIRGEGTLGEVFERLVASDHLTKDDEESFYAFVLDLHQRSLLSLPINDADTLFQRYEKRRRAEQLGRVLGIFFLRVPLFNPDQFLARTLPFFRWLFTLPALVLWVLLMGAAGAVVVGRSGELSSPVLTMLDGNNVYMLFAALIGLKIIHEFGHAYACRAFGGHVPEMGMFLVMFTPLAYVDATDSWTFSKTHRRAIVTLGGVYFESIVGAIAVFVWATTEPSTLNTLAYQVMVLATVTTALFNLNPLLRYDAYYLVSDLAGIPNLRARCQEAVAALLKRTVYGLRKTPEGEPLRPSPGLAAFGFAQIAYRVTVMISIATILILKFGGAGMVIAVLITGMGLGKGVVKLARYLISSPEIEGLRFRAVVTTVGVAAIVTAGVGLIPIPYPIHANGVVSFERVTALRAPSRGVLAELPATVGQRTRPGQTLAVIENPDLEAELRNLAADAEASRSKAVLASMTSPGEALMALSETARFESHRDQIAADLDDLRLVAPTEGRVLDLLVPKPGTAVEEGEAVLVHGSGAVEAVFHVRALDFQSLRTVQGDWVVCRSPAYPARDIVGEVTHIGRVGARAVEPRVARAVPDGLVPVNSATGEVIDAYFEIHLRLPPEDAEFAGSLLKARFPAYPRTTAQMLERRVKRFLNRIRESNAQ